MLDDFYVTQYWLKIPGLIFHKVICSHLESLRAIPFEILREGELKKIVDALH